MQERELAYRTGDGLDVSLRWNPSDDSLSVSVLDVRLGTVLVVPVEDASPLDVFHHPFAYAARRGAALAA